MALLSVDIGTGGTRSVLFTETGKIIASSYREYDMVHPRPGWAELDAEVIWAAFMETVHDITGQHRKQIKASAVLYVQQYRAGAEGQDPAAQRHPLTGQPGDRRNRHRLRYDRRNGIFQNQGANGCVRPADYVKSSG